MFNKKITINVFSLGVLGLTLILLLVTAVRADTQDKQFYQDYVQFENARKLIQQSNYSDAQRSLDSLMPRYQKSYPVNWYYAICLEEQGQYEQAIPYFDKAIKLRTALLWQPNFLFYYGKTLMNAGDYSRAEKYLQSVIKIDLDPELSKQSQQLLMDIHNKRSIERNGQ